MQLNRTYIKEIKKNKVLLKGWVHELRDLSNIKFILLRDITGIVQCIIKKDSKDWNKSSEITTETVIEIQGKPKSSNVKSDQVTLKNLEIEIESINILNKSEALPIQVYEKDKTIKTDLSKRLDYRSLDLRKPKIRAIFKIESTAIKGMQEYLNKNGFLQVFTPCIMGVTSEGGAEVFRVNYYGKEAFLRQDPQLHRQLTILGGIERLYDLGPSWRAEKSYTTRHICEHRVCAPEMAFIKDESDIMRLEEGTVVNAIKRILEDCKEELEILNIKLKVPETPFPEFRFPKIYDILKSLGKEITYGEDLDTEAHKVFYAYVKKRYKTDFYFFNRFPSAIKPFYVMRVDDEPEFARSVDLNCKGIELSSGGQREHRYDKLIEQVKEKKLNPKGVEWFTRFFKWGSVPHGGFAIGIERFTQTLLNLDNIKESVLFPRDPERLVP